MKLYPQYDITYPFILSDGSIFERRQLVGFISHRQHLARRAAFRRAFRGVLFSEDMEARLARQEQQHLEDRARIGTLGQYIPAIRHIAWNPPLNREE